MFLNIGLDREELVLELAAWVAPTEKQLFFWGFLLTFIENLGLYSQSCPRAKRVAATLRISRFFDSAR